VLLRDEVNIEIDKTDDFLNFIKRRTKQKFKNNPNNGMIGKSYIG